MLQCLSKPPFLFSTTTDNNNFSTNYVNDGDETTTQAERDGKTTRHTDKPHTTTDNINAIIDVTTEKKKESNHPFIRYFKRLRRIYELDLKILDQIATLLEGISDEVLPQIAEVLEPLLISQTVNMLDLGQILGYVAQTIHSSTFHFSASTSLGRLKFLNVGRLLQN